MTSFSSHMSGLNTANCLLAIEETRGDPVTTQLWESAMREQVRREQQWARMKRWRKQKKEKDTGMVQERLRLEKELQRRVHQARLNPDHSPRQSIGNAFRQATLECAALTRENLALKKAIEQQTKFESMLRLVAQEMASHVSDLSVKETQLHLEGEEGWRVNFPNDEPSFHFSPFSRAEFDRALRESDVAYAERHPCTATVGKILGWTVDCAPLRRNESGTAFVAHATFTRRLHCSLDESQKILPRLDNKLWPVLVTPRSWGHVQTGDTSCQGLQSFHEDAHVMVCNIPGQATNLRYVALSLLSREVGSDGKRVDKYTMTVAYSDASNRASENPQERVQWIMEGGVYVTITEVDGSTIDVVYDQWAGCLSEMHGRELYIDWIRFPVRLEQSVSPARLL
ncbi:hypothetical protein PF004_g28967 [Phytophthora fragariae]|nr:hypothetical protein PF004_g28967 [Phytophthora fragariae]